MSVNPTSFRLPFSLPEEVHPAVRDALRLTYQGVADLNQAIAALVPKINASTNPAVVNNVTQTIESVITGGGGGSSNPPSPSNPPIFGAVNLQPNRTAGAYTLAQSDFAALILVQSQIAFALTLNSGLNVPFFTTVYNLGAGTITATPTAATITNAPSLVNNQINTLIGPFELAIFYFDGNNWWAVEANDLVIQVNSKPTLSGTQVNFNDNTPSAPSGMSNVNWQQDALDPTNLSVNVPNIGGIDPRTTVSETIGQASQGKLVTLNNGSAIAVALDSTAGGGGGGVLAYDMVQWVSIGYPLRTTNHFVGTQVYSANWMDADGQKIWLIKNTPGNPWDVYKYDTDWIYHYITENADQGTWSTATAHKDFVTPVPVIPRFFFPGSTVTKNTNGSNPIRRTVNCGTDAQPLINIGNISAVTTGPVTTAWGGDVGTVPTITVSYYYGKQREEFKYGQGFGLIEWTHASLTGGSYVIDQTTLHVTLANGGCPSPNFPCYSSMVSAGTWIGGVPGAGGNVPNPASAPPTSGVGPSTFYCAVKNIGVGTATLTPTSGLINGVANLVLATGLSKWLFFDGTNWQSV